MARPPTSARRRQAFALVAFGIATATGGAWPRAEARAEARAAEDPSAKPWCGPDVTELSDHVCFVDAAPEEGRRTLLLYLHGSLALTPGFQYVQQKGMARQVRDRRMALLMPTAPRTESGYWWPSGAALRAQEASIVEGFQRAKAALEARSGRPFDEVVVVGFSSGAYFASALALRGALDVDGYIILAGGSSWARPAGPETRRVPVFVGVSAEDGQTRDHSRAFAGTLAALRWPYRVDERPVGHLVDPVFLSRGLAWLHGRRGNAPHPP